MWDHSETPPTGRPVLPVVVGERFDATTTHWVSRGGWRTDRRKYALHLTMERAEPVRRTAAQVQQALAGVDVLDVVPERWLHLTMTSIGFVDETTPQQAERIAGPVFDAWRRLHEPQLATEALLVARESVRLTYQPSDWLAGLVALQRRLCDEVLGAREWMSFRPHTSLAYCHGEVPKPVLASALTELAPQLPPPGPVTPTLTLLELRREQPLYDWTVLQQA